MKKILAAALALLLLAAWSPALAETWYCPQCGRLNDNNFCPVDGTARPVLNTVPKNDASYYTEFAHVTAALNARLSTRTGPGTRYDEPGTFLRSGDSVTILSKAYDANNEIWWVQTEFRDGGQWMRAYTGVKRFTGLNLNSIPEEREIGSCVIGGSIRGYYGPSFDYKPISRKVPAGALCAIYARAWHENGSFLQIEFFDEGLKQLRRAWVPDWEVGSWNLFAGF